MPRHAAQLAFAFLLLLGSPTPAAPADPPVPRPPRSGAAPDTSILFETSIPLNELPLAGWSPAQKNEVAYILERMKRDDRIFLVVSVVTDPVGDARENAAAALAVAGSVADRLRRSGVPRDRVTTASGGEDTAIFESLEWSGFRSSQKILIRGMQGGEWLRRPAASVAVREELPPEGSLRIASPAAGETDTAHHTLQGTTEESVKTVALVMGRETMTAAVYGGKFEVPISLRPGLNRIVVTGLDRFGRALRDVREIRYAPPKPTIELSSPAPNSVADLSRTPVITVKGRVASRAPLARVSLIQNDTPRVIPVREDGRFEQRAVLITDEDVFTVEARDIEGRTGVSEPRTIPARGIALRPLMAILHWDEDDVDLDLHVTDDLGGHTFFDAPDVMRSTTAIPGGTLWIDNRKGYGPEVFTIEGDASGSYTFFAQYYRGRKPCRAYLTVVVFAGSPSRRMVRLFGPIAMTPGMHPVPVARGTFPEGAVTDLTKRP